MQRALMYSLAAAGLVWATSAAADQPRLKGQYAYTGTHVCLTAPGTGPFTPGVARANAGFNANLAPVVGSAAFYFSLGSQGIYILDGHGHGTVSGTSVSTTTPPSASATLATFTSSITYVVNADGSWGVDVLPGSLLGTYLKGSRTGQTFSQDIRPLTGMISGDGKVLTLTTPDAVIETQTISTGEVDPRVCHRSEVLIRLQGGDDEGRGPDQH
jgi:hypothetical protein